MKREIVIYGTGSMARVLYSFLVADDHFVTAFCEDEEYIKGRSSFLDHPLLSLQNIREKNSWLTPESSVFLMGIGFHQMNKVRKAVFDELDALGFLFGSYTYHAVQGHVGAKAMAGLVVYDGVAIHTGTAIDQNVFISSNVSLGHDCYIGAHSWINSGVSLGGGVKLGERCVIGMNSVIAQGVTLGEATYVGANTLVTQDTQPDAVVVSESPWPLTGMSSERFLKLARQP